MESGIYKIIQVGSETKYVGSAVNVASRWRVHLHQLRHGKHHSRRLQAAWNKYGEDSFFFQVIEIVAIKSLIEREQYWIDRLGAYGASGFNCNPKAGSSLGRKFSDETKARMSEDRKGKTHSEESKALMSLHRKGRTLTEEHRRKIGESQKGRIQPESVRKAVAKANAERVHSPETRAKLSEAAKRRKQKALYAWGIENGVTYKDGATERDERLAA